MILEELIYKRFTESEELIKLFARFSGRPAVFSPEAPEDNMSGWENKKQYPRLIYNYDLIITRTQETESEWTRTEIQECIGWLLSGAAIRCMRAM